MKSHTTNRGLQGSAFMKDMTSERHQPPDSRIRILPGAARRVMRTATTPSKRERALPSSVHPKIEQVFTPTNTDRHRSPDPSYHASHMAMATGQHQASGSAHENHTTTSRVAALASKTLTPPHPRSIATPPKTLAERSRISHHWRTPSAETQTTARTGLHRLVL